MPHGKHVQLLPQPALPTSASARLGPNPRPPAHANIAAAASPPAHCLVRARSYSSVLRRNPRCPAEVRLGIAACFYRAGKLGQAAAAYERALALDAGCADALLGLAVIKFGGRDAQEVWRMGCASVHQCCSAAAAAPLVCRRARHARMQGLGAGVIATAACWQFCALLRCCTLRAPAQGLNAGLQLLQRAYEADPSHPGVLCALSHFALLKEQPDQVSAAVRVLL